MADDPRALDPTVRTRLEDAVASLAFTPAVLREDIAAALAALAAAEQRATALHESLAWTLDALGDPPCYTGPMADWLAAKRLIGRG